MPAFTAIVRAVSADKFTEIFSASTRKAREAYYHRHGIRKGKKSNRVAKLSAGGEERTQHLYDLLKETEDDDMVEEVLRTWLLSKRPMLAAALDHLGVPHDGGLTESEKIDEIFGGISPKDLRSMFDKLRETYPADDVLVYLRFMGAANVDSLA